MTRPPPPLPHERRRRIVFRILIFGPLVLFLGLLVWHLLWRRDNAQALARLDAEARARGEPLTVEDLMATYPPVPDERNAYVALEAIWSLEDPPLWSAFRQGARTLPRARKESYDPALPVLGSAGAMSHTNELSPKARDAAARFLETKAAALAALPAALQRPEFRAPIRMQDGWNALLPHLEALRKTGAWLRIEAIVALDRGDLGRALSATETIAQLGHWLERDPLILGQLVRVSLYDMVLTSTERVLAFGHPDDTQLQRLAALLETLKAHDGLKRAFLGERVMVYHLFQASPESALSAAEPPASEASNPGELSDEESVRMTLRLLGSVGLRDADLRLIAEAFAECLVCAEQSDFAVRDDFQRIFERLEKKAREFPPKFMTRMLMPGLANASDKFARLEARRRAALAAVALQSRRIRQPALDGDSLTRLAAEMLAAAPPDPYTGQPLRFAARPTGFLIYALGSDRQDDAGTPRPSKYSGTNSPPFDVAFHVEAQATTP
ncbi:MAG: hypothetical protein IT580_19205 [Verrucomicrobiales bacterium]|nr:hypothetical protein [Verrucomicrobiales bacterium]